MEGGPRCLPGAGAHAGNPQAGNATPRAGTPARPPLPEPRWGLGGGCVGTVGMCKNGGPQPCLPHSRPHPAPKQHAATSRLGTSCRMSTRRSEEEASALARSDMHAGPSPGSWAEGPREPLALGTRPQTLTAHCVWAAVWPGWATAGLGGLGPAEGKGKEAQIIQLEGTAAQAKPVHSEDVPTAANDREDSGQCRRGPGPWRR